MRHQVRSAILLCALVSIAPPSLANGPDAQVTVTPLPANATLSGASQNRFAGYLVRVANVSDDTLKILKLTGKTTVAPAAATGTATFVKSIGSVTCTPIVATDIECVINQLLGIGGSLQFVVIFKTPAFAVVNSPTAINFATKTLYAEYEHHEPYIDDIEAAYKTASTALGAPSASQVDSYIPDTGATLFTGAGNSPSATLADPWTTEVSSPPGQASTASVLETIDPTTCAADLLTCNISAISIPDVSVAVAPFLKITLRRDVSTIGSASTSYSKKSDDDKRKPNIKNWVVYYRKNTSGPDSTFIAVPECYKVLGVVVPMPGVPGAGQPCVAKRTAIPKTDPVVDDRGDWKIEI